MGKFYLFLRNSHTRATCVTVYTYYRKFNVRMDATKTRVGWFLFHVHAYVCVSTTNIPLPTHVHVHVCVRSYSGGIREAALGL